MYSLHKTAALFVSLAVAAPFAALPAPASAQADAGHAMHAHKHHGHGLALRMRIRRLPEDQRKLFHQAMAPHRDAIRSARMAHRLKRDALRQDIGAQNYDAAKVAADFKAFRQSADAVHDERDAALVEAIGKLSPQSRATLSAETDEQAQ